MPGNAAGQKDLVEVVTTYNKDVSVGSESTCNRRFITHEAQRKTWKQGGGWGRGCVGYLVGLHGKPAVSRHIAL